MAQRFNIGSSSAPFLQAVVANKSGEIFELDEYAALGMAAGNFAPLSTTETVPVPHGSEFMRLPQRRPVVYSIRKQRAVTLIENPYSPGEPIYPVAIFNSPGYMITHVCAYEEEPRVDSLPLFSYGAVGWYGNGFQSAAKQIDAEPRQDLKRMPQEKILAGVRQMRRQMPKNRLCRHLENCALVYGCPAAKNFYLGRYEAPLPTSRRCNARCQGCISLQENTGIQPSQQRINFTPTPDEIAEVALMHIAETGRPVVSFGQGCEGDPLLAADVIGPAIRAIRKKTSSGTINMNTNASRPDILDRLFDAGLDSIRVSLNSVRPDGYNRYFRPRGYRFVDVVRSIDLSVSRNRFVAINYLNSPGFTDTPEELGALTNFIRNHSIHMIQWRNLNFDPMRYWQIVNPIVPSGQPMGMHRFFNTIKRQFPSLMHGYFNPPKEKWFQMGKPP